MNEFFNALLDWLESGLLHATGWQLVVYTLVVTHITIAGVTIFLHILEGRIVLAVNLSAASIDHVPRIRSEFLKALHARFKADHISFARPPRVI
jgi:hypothetical protein